MTTTQTTRIPLRLRRAIAWALLGLTLFAAAYLIVWGFIIIAQPLTEDDLRDLPLQTIEVGAGDTWWTIAETCPVDRRVAVEYLAARSNTDADAPLHPGQLVTTCAEVTP